MQEGEYRVRNRILTGRGAPSMIAGEYLTLEKDCGLGLGTEERTHFRTLSKRTRERIEESVDRRNGYVVKEARKEIKKLKTKLLRKPKHTEIEQRKLQHKGKQLYIKLMRIIRSIWNIGIRNAAHWRQRKQNKCNSINWRWQRC